MPVALITGASRGLGLVLAQQFWRAGYDLCLVARNSVALEDCIRSLESRPDQCVESLAADLMHPGTPDAVVGAAISRFGRCDALVNNAAIHGPIGPAWDNDRLSWRQAIDVNLIAPVALCQVIAPHMMEQKSGSIINISGGGATGPRANFSAYATAKAGLVRFSETFADELKPFGVRVNCIAPGAMKTTLLGELLEKSAQEVGDKELKIARKVFEGGGAPPELAADLALFLASEQSTGITGRLISAVWDNWQEWPRHLDELNLSDAYTLRRIAGRDRSLTWGDK